MSVIWSGFRRLADFSGRDRRGRFWPYALVVAVLVYVGLMLAMIPTMATMFGEAARYAAENPDQATVVAGPGYYSVQIHDPDAALMPDFTPFFWTVRIAGIAAGVLLAAAVTRRLHDTDRAGWWGLPPLVLLAGVSAIFPSVVEGMMQEADPPLAGFFLMFGLGVLYNLSLIGLVVLLCLKGTTGTNRYGPEPG